MIYQSDHQSPIGRLTLASDGTNLIGLWMEGQKYFGSTIKEEMVRREDLPLFSLTKSWLDRYFAGEKPLLSEIPLAPAGSPFRQRVWKLLCEIPYGEVTTYGDLARKLATVEEQGNIPAQNGAAREHDAAPALFADDTNRRSGAAQAVGGAVGHNPISIIIPCHRVVGANGSLTGYAGGLEKKRRLLELEGVDITSSKGHITVLKR